MNIPPKKSIGITINKTYYFNEKKTENKAKQNMLFDSDSGLTK